MFVKRNIPPIDILKFSWKYLLYYIILGTAVFVLHNIYEFKQIAIPFLPLATIGTAVAFYLGFKNNSSYDRLWEGRKIWGALVNSSRTFGTWIINWTGDGEIDENELQEIKKEIIYRHLGFINVLKTQLRKTSVWNNHKYHKISSRITGETLEEMYDKNVKLIMGEYLTEYEKENMRDQVNKATYLLVQQSKMLTDLKRRHLLTEFEHSDLENMIGAFFNHQGAAERIKTFPFPRQYGFFSSVFVNIFVTLLPFGLIGTMSNNGLAWLAIPMSVLISWIFITMESIGDSSENPFENGINDVPLNAICRTIEIDLKQMLGEKDPPPKIEPINGVLM